MPLVAIDLIEDVFTPDQKAQIIQNVTDAMVSVVGEALRDATWVKINEIKENDWAIGGRPLDAASIRRNMGANLERV